MASLKEEMNWEQVRVSRLSLQSLGNQDDAIQEIVELDSFSKKKAAVLELTPVRYRNGECEAVIGFTRSEIFLLHFEN